MHPPHTDTNRNPQTARGPLTTCPCPYARLLALPWLPTAARSSRGSSAWRPRSCPTTLPKSLIPTGDSCTIVPIPRYRLPFLASGLCNRSSALFPYVCLTLQGATRSEKPFLPPRGLPSSSVPHRAQADISALSALHPWCACKCLTTSSPESDPEFGALSNSHGVNTPTKVDAGPPNAERHTVLQLFLLCRHDRHERPRERR